MLKMLCISLLCFSSIAAADIQITVRTEDMFALGTNCDPDIVVRTPPYHVGIVNANCASVRFLPQTPVVVEGDGEVAVLIGNPLIEFFEHCQLVSTQRNPGKKVFEAWNFECRNN